MVSENQYGNLNSAKSNIIRYYFIEFLRRIVFLIFGNRFFDFPILIIVRAFFYRLVFHITSSTTIGGHVRFTRDHKMEDGFLKAGKFVFFGNDVHIDFSGGINIEDYVSIAEGVLIYTHNHSIIGSEDELLYNRKKRSITPTTLHLRKSCWIGARAIITPGVSEIGENAIVTAGSVVTQNVPKNAIVRGNPARVVTIYR